MSAKPGIDFPGVGAGLLIRRDDGMVLLYRRLNAPEAGHWNIVGGKVDLMETAADAARREAEEETGLRIGSVEFLCSAEGIISADGQHWISLIYTTTEFSGAPQLTEPDKLSDFGWFSPDAPPEPLSTFTRTAFAALKPV
jgi:ADP-ribose pyrophosphatase YjhB (NUDIX family)